jgi:hypothetical protein
VSTERTNVANTDGDEGRVEAPSYDLDKGAVAYMVLDGWFDRENAVRTIEALTGLVEAADAREAEARKLKRGDKVRLSTRFTERKYTVVTDEVDGRVDVVDLDDGRLWERQRAHIFERIAAPSVPF